MLMKSRVHYIVVVPAKKASLSLADNGIKTINPQFLAIKSCALALLHFCCVIFGLISKKKKKSQLCPFKVVFYFFVSSIRSPDMMLKASSLKEEGYILAKKRSPRKNRSQFNYISSQHAIY